MSTSGDPPQHEAIQPLAWILGKWRAESGGEGKYPTIKPFEYAEEVHFFSVGQPNVQFSMYSWHPETKQPMHREVGFIRIQPKTNKIALFSAQNIGVTDIEEGEVTKQTLTVTTTAIHRISFAKDPETKKVVRTFSRTGDKLQHDLLMETFSTPLTQHLSITYTKIE